MGPDPVFLISGLAKVKHRVLYTKVSAKLPHLTIWNKKLKNLLLWDTGLIWSKFSFCSIKNNPIQPCEIHIFFPFIFGGNFFLMDPYYLRAPLCIVKLLMETFFEILTFTWPPTTMWPSSEPYQAIIRIFSSNKYCGRWTNQMEHLSQSPLWVL